MTENPDIAFRFATLAGVLTVATIIIVVLANVTHSWISHRSEHHFSYTIKRVIKVATGRVSEQRREAAMRAPEKFGLTNMVNAALDAMRITRDEEEEPKAKPQRPAGSAALPARKGKG